ncbi:hypothetical protein Tco_0454050 [Tanacetum coccineum]
MDCAINDFESEFMSMSTILEEIRSAIRGGGGSHSNRESDNHDDSMSLQEEEDYGYEVTGEPKGRFNGPRVMNRRMKGRHGYQDRQRYRVKAKIPNFLENLDPEAVLDWLYEVNKFFDIMDVLKEEQVKILAYKLCGGSEAWWQNEQDNHRRQGKKKIVVECIREFLRLQVRCNLKESLEQTASSNRKVGIVVVLSSIDAAIEVMYQSKSVEDNYGLSSYVVGGLVRRYLPSRWLRVKKLLFLLSLCSLPGHRSNECPNRKMNAYVGENHEGDTEIDFGDDLEHISEFAQDEGEVVNLMVQRRPKIFPEKQDFETKCLIEDNICSLIIDGGSYKNLVRDS